MKSFGLKIALVTGCFDIIHAGHIALLEHAYLLGGHVWVGMNSDAAVARLKGPHRPINCYEQRRIVMSAIRYVEHVFVIDADRVDGAIRATHPTWWVKGGDYTLATLDKGEVEAAHAMDAQIVLFHSPHDVSSTKLLSKI